MKQKEGFLMNKRQKKKKKKKNQSRTFYDLILSVIGELLKNIRF